jgi:beta-glucosidase
MSESHLRYNRIDPAVEQRIDELLAKMTLAEKIGQLVQVTTFAFPEPKTEPQESLTETEINTLEAWKLPVKPRPILEAKVRAGEIGSIFSTPDPGLVNHYQRIAVEESPQGIPLIVGNDVIHGFRTIFPIPLAEACTWDPELLQRASKAAAEEASACGTDWTFAPMVDIARDPRWGRIAEGAGEDPYLGRAMARARLLGFQAPDLESGRRMVTCPKHYAAYGATQDGRDYNTVDISERTLREVYLPPFKAALDAGAGSVMSSFNELSGIPSTANKLLLDTILRQEWQWPGLVVSDYEAVMELTHHGLAADLKEASRLSILAGVDMDMMGMGYHLHLKALVEEGAVPEARIDEAARRVLRLKLQIGLFDHPYCDEIQARQVILREDFRQLALEVARQSMVLLKNEDGLLPITPGEQRIALVGPLADNRADLLGAWALYGQAQDAETVLEGLQTYLQDKSGLVYAPGCPIRERSSADIPDAVAAAQAADVVVAVLGESADMSGEAHSRAHLGLPGSQQELLDALSQTGKPIVLVLMSGRPLAVHRAAGQANALVAAWHGGIRAGQAVADLLFGTVNPSGKLTASWPRAEGQVPIYYAHKNTGRPLSSAGTVQFLEAFKSRYIDESNEPLFPFGYGLSYTTFSYRDLQIETPKIGPGSSLVASAVVENTGSLPGAEVVQLYVRDLVASVTRPVKELKGFQRIPLQPGKAQTVRFEVPATELGFIGLDLDYVVEPGAFKLWIGPDSTRGLEGQFVLE